MNTPIPIYLTSSLEVTITLDYGCLDFLCFFGSSTAEFMFFLPVDISVVSIILLLGILLVQTFLSPAIHAQDFR